MRDQYNFVDKNGVLFIWNWIKATFVKKETGKDLSSNDYTTAEKNKLAGLTNTTVVDNLTSTSASEALSANQGRVLNAKIDMLSMEAGAGDMLKSAYDTNGNGVVDNSERLGGELPAYYENVIESVRVNGSALPIVSKSVNVIVPTGTSELSNDAGFQTASQVMSAIDSKLTAVYKPKGTIAFENLPAPSESNLGYVWNMLNAFVTTASFIEGAGHTHASGTNVAVASHEGSYMFDVLAGTIDLSEYMRIDDMIPITNSELEEIMGD